MSDFCVGDFYFVLLSVVCTCFLCFFLLCYLFLLPLFLSSSLSLFLSFSLPLFLSFSLSLSQLSLLYHFQSYVLFGDGEVYQMFAHVYDSVSIHLKDGPWYINSGMKTGKPMRNMYNNLQAFWPGLQTLEGDVNDAVETLRAFHLVRELY